MKITPKLRYNSLSKEFEKELVKFTKEIIASVKYWSKARLHKVGIETKDANPATIMKNTFKDLIKQWDSKSKEFAKSLSKRQIQRLNKYVASRYTTLTNKQVKELLHYTKTVTKTSYYTYIKLIKSIPQEIISKYENTIYKSVANNNAWDIEHELKRISDVSVSRARLIARDQTAKTIEQLNRTQQQELGIEYYIWETAQDERVSKGKGGHEQLNGIIFRYDTPEAIIDSYGTKGHPGERVNCRCTSRGVFLEPNEKIVKRKNGYGYEIRNK